MAPSPRAEARESERHRIPSQVLASPSTGDIEVGHVFDMYTSQEMARSSQRPPTHPQTSASPWASRVPIPDTQGEDSELEEMRRRLEALKTSAPTIILKPPDNLFHTRADTFPSANGGSSMQQTLTYWNEAMGYFHRYDWQEGLAFFRKAILHVPRDASDMLWRLWANIGLVYSHLGQDFKAQASFFRAAKLDPKNAILWFLKGCAEYSMVDSAGARVAWDFGRRKKEECKCYEAASWSFRRCLKCMGRLEKIDCRPYGLQFELERVKVQWNKNLADGKGVPHASPPLGLTTGQLRQIHQDIIKIKRQLGTPTDQERDRADSTSEVEEAGSYEVQARDDSRKLAHGLLTGRIQGVQLGKGDRPPDVRTLLSVKSLDERETPELPAEYLLRITYSCNRLPAGTLFGVLPRDKESKKSD